jgi:hypothetical protein
LIWNLKFLKSKTAGEGARPTLFGSFIHRICTD